MLVGMPLRSECSMFQALRRNLIPSADPGQVAGGSGGLASSKLNKIEQARNLTSAKAKPVYLTIYKHSVIAPFALFFDRTGMHRVPIAYLVTWVRISGNEST